MKLKYGISITENKTFQGTDLQSALFDAERILEEVEKGNGRFVTDNWEDAEGRVQNALEAVNVLIFEIDQTRKSELCRMAEELAHRDAEVMKQMAETYAGIGMRLVGDETTKYLILGHPNEMTIPWYVNLPGGREVIDWSDDFGLEIQAAYNEQMTDELCEGGPSINIGDISIEDNCVWVRVRTDGSN